eukprot:CAMPEP_0202870920 /NCGR_PEP_ID=MMETSP1391-20130828/17196_1 /ASSEMBLY_ACC=CAM_ASM_000867 /TAXON_ID=1034604 /ORGANISM="Chlamydomonas leiostraca, Strain SAG 11-49" /LENGTH=628 /DNA_ID=CAMNT_0049551595 /DNA_START=52 /DNA_END=1935 /DNA_ORIENTATION=-
MENPTDFGLSNLDGGLGDTSLLEFGLNTMPDNDLLGGVLLGAGPVVPVRPATGDKPSPAALVNSASNGGEGEQVGSVAQQQDETQGQPTSQGGTSSKRGRGEDPPKRGNSRAQKKKLQESRPSTSQQQQQSSQHHAGTPQFMPDSGPNMMMQSHYESLMMPESGMDNSQFRQLGMGGKDPNGPALCSEHELKQAYCNSVQALKDYITVSNLMSYDITGKNLPDKVTTDLKTLIHQISKVCLQAIKPETPFVMDVISKDYAQATTTDWELDKSHWINVIAHLTLTEQQVQTILRSRMLHVEKMMVIYQERAQYAKQASELALMSATIGQARTGFEDHSMMGVLLRHGYLYCARYMVTVHRLTELIRESLQREQKTVMELFLKVVYQILSPVQAALFVVESFPYHCDVLALANVLAVLYSKEGAGQGVGSSNGMAAGSGMGMGGPGMGMGMGGQGGLMGAGNEAEGMLGMGMGGLGGGPGGLEGLGLGSGPGGLGMGLGGQGAEGGLSLQGRPGMQGAGGAPGPSSEGLARLRTFLDSAGAAACIGGLGGSSMGDAGPANSGMARSNASGGNLQGNGPGPSGPGNMGGGLGGTGSMGGPMGGAGGAGGMSGMVPVNNGMGNGMDGSGIMG